MLGRQEYDKAIDYLRAGLKGDRSDFDSLAMIANCYHWAGRHDQAIVACEEALKVDSSSFDMHALVAQLFVEKGDHENAVIHARIGLECYPEPLPTIPRWITFIFRLLGRVFPSLRDSDPNEGLRSMEASRAEWFAWAKQYLTWHDATHGGTGKPVVH
jgi:tetratricopeptide (TPR) repeat protein